MTTTTFTPITAPARRTDWALRAFVEALLSAPIPYARGAKRAMLRDLGVSPSRIGELVP